MDTSERDFDLLKLDVAKLHSEVNQFRNQEFWACSFAIGIFGASIGAVSKSPSLSIGVLILLLGLFLWHYTLVDTRSRVTSYLKFYSLSKWETRYRDFANKTRYPSQRTAATITFAVLGLLVLLASISSIIDPVMANTSPRPSDAWLVAMIFSQAIYQLLVIIFGLKQYTRKIEEYQGIWEKQAKGEALQQI